MTAPMKTWLITGSSRGIGLEHVRQALAAGDKVIAACREPARADALAALREAQPARLRLETLDVADAASVQALADRLAGEPIDVLLNNAGIYGPPGTPGWPEGAAAQSLQGMDCAHWEHLFRTNVMGPFRMTAALLPNLLAGQRRLVVMMSSDLGSIEMNTQGTSHAYRSSKAALNMLARGLAIDLQAQGVKVVALAPGWTRTELGGGSGQWSTSDSVAAQRLVLEGAGAVDSGRFINLTGEYLPW